MRARLSVLPLPKAALGPAAGALRLQRDSGVISSGGADKNHVVLPGLPVAPNRTFGFSGLVPGKEGYVSGYALDYGIGSSGGAGVTEVRTSVDEYRTSDGAKKGLAVWRAADRRVPAYGGGGLSITIDKEKVAHVGSRRFALLASYRAANITPLFGLDEQFTISRYEADVTVWAGTAAAAKQLAPKLAKKLEARIRRALAGRLHVNRVELPPKQRAERWPGGPDLSSLALKPADVGSKGPPFLDNYFVGEDPFALSYFKVLIFNAGQYDAVGQEIEWFATANQASFTEDFDTALYGSSSIDVSSVGDGAKAAGNSSYAAIYLSSGQLMEFIHMQSQAGSIQPSGVQAIARTAAGYIDSAGLGS